MTDRSFEIRPADAKDEAFLWECLALAAYAEDADEARRDPYLSKWLNGWPKSNEFGAIAQIGNRPVGACWARQFAGPDPALAIYIDDRTPEIAVAVMPEARGRGIGEALVKTMCDKARQRDRAGLCLTVRSNNPAIRLYERLGFEYVAEAERINRVGGVSYGMVLRF